MMVARRTLSTDSLAGGLHRSAFRSALRARKPKQPEQPQATAGPVARESVAAVRPEKLDDLVALYSTVVPPLYDGLDGFQGALLLVDGNEAKSITLWRSARCMADGASTDTYREAMQSLAVYFVGAPETRTWRAAVTHLPPQVARLNC
jgi:heme-degrading monooxygenase HmoA